MEILVTILLISHFLGLAAIIGPFFLQMRRKTDFNLHVMLAGVITQLVTGLALVAIAELNDFDINTIWISAKLGIAIIVLVLLILAKRRQTKLFATGSTDRGILPFFHSAGALAIINVIVAVGF